MKDILQLIKYWLNRYPISVRIVSIFFRAKKGIHVIEKFSFSNSVVMDCRVGEKMQDCLDSGYKSTWVYLGKGYFKLINKEMI